MNHFKTKLYAISYDPTEQWTGIFFADDVSARNALDVVRKEIADGSGSRIALDELTVSIPSSPDELAELFNSGPRAFIEARLRLAAE